MKLSNLTAKFAWMKGKATRVLAAGVLAGAVLVATPAAKAQRFSFGVQFGGPAYGRGYYAPPPPPPRYYGYGNGYGSGYYGGYPYGYGYRRPYYGGYRGGRRSYGRYPYGYGYRGY